MFRLVAKTEVDRPKTKVSQCGTRCVVFNDRIVRCYELGEIARLLWSRDDLSIVDCAFVDGEAILVSSENALPRVICASSGNALRTIESPVRRTLRTRFGEVFTHSDGTLFLRTSYPFKLVELEKKSLLAKKSLAAESLSNVIFHPKDLMFAGVVDATAQEVVFGSFESTPFFCDSSLHVLPYLHSLGISASGRWLHIVCSDERQTKLVTLDLVTRVVASAILIDLGLDKTVALRGNRDKVLIVPKVAPVAGENRVMLFKSIGSALVVDTVGGVVQEVSTPHNDPVCSVSQSQRTGTFVSSDWTGCIVQWDFGGTAAEEFQSWDFVVQDCSVLGSHEARPIHILH